MRRPITILLLLGSSCAFESPVATPTITAVSPMRVRATESVALTIEGTGFEVVASATLGKEQGDVEAVSVSIGGLQLEDVVVESATTIRATLPSGLDVQTYDVVVQIGDRVATFPGFVVEPPFRVEASAPADLAFGETGDFSLTFDNDTDRSVEVEILSVSTDAADVEVGAPNFSTTIPASGADVFDATLRNRSTETKTITVTARLSWKSSSMMGAFDLSASVDLLGTASTALLVDFPARLEVGQIATLTATITNSGPLPLEAVTVAVTPSAGLGVLDTATVPDELDAGESTSIRVRVRGSTVAAASLSVRTTGRATRGTSTVDETERVSVDVLGGPKLLIESFVLPTAVEVGVAADGSAVVTNGGDIDLVQGELELQATGGTVSSAAFPTLAAGQSTTVAVTVTASTRGVPVRVDATAAGESERSGARVVSPTATASTAPALAPPALRVTAAVAPDPTTVGQSMRLDVTLHNDGDIAVDDAQPTGLTFAATAVADGPRVPPTTVAISGGASQTFTYPLRASTVGTFTATVAASGVHSGSGALVTAPPIVTAPVAVLLVGPPTVEIVAPAASEVLASQQFALVVGAEAAAGRTLANIQVSVTGPATISGPMSAPQSAAVGGGVFVVDVSPAATAGQTVVLSAEAEDDTGQIGMSTSRSLDVVSAPSLVWVRCAPADIVVSDNDSQTQLRLEAFYANGDRIDVSASAVWTTSNVNVATVNEGTVRGRNGGTVSITGTLGAQSSVCTVRVATQPFIVQPERLVVSVGGTTQLRYARQDRANFTELTTDGDTGWSTSNAAIATVSGAGLVTGIAPGLASITACNDGSDCVTATVLVAVDLDLPGALGPGPIAISGAHSFQSVVLRSGADVYTPRAPTGGAFFAWADPLELTVAGPVSIEAGADLHADGAGGQPGSQNGAHGDFEAEGGSAGNVGGGGGAGSGGGSDRCGGDNCGGAGTARGADACSNGGCSGGNGGGVGGAGGAPPTVGENGGFAGGGAGHGGRGGCGGTITTGCAGLRGTASTDASGAGSGGGGGDGAGGAHGPGGGGGGGGGVLRFTLTGTSGITIDGRLAAKGGSGGVILRGGRAGGGGGGSGGLIDITAPTIDGVGILDVAGGFGGSGSDGTTACGGGGGGGGGRIVLSSARAGPFLRIGVEGGRGGAPCTIGGAPGVDGEVGTVTRP